MSGGWYLWVGGWVGGWVSMGGGSGWWWLRGIGVVGGGGGVWCVVVAGGGLSFVYEPGREAIHTNKFILFDG